MPTLKIDGKIPCHASAGWHPVMKDKEMKKLTHIIYEENGAFVAQCLNCDVASCGDSYEEALHNIKEAVELFYEDEADAPYHHIGSVHVMEQYIHA